MAEYSTLSAAELADLKNELQNAYRQIQSLGLKLDMSRGKPSAEQLNLSMGMLDVLTSADILETESGTDVRNYGLLEGIPEARHLFADLLEVNPSEVFVGGNSSLNLMYDTVARAMQFGVGPDQKPWGQQGRIRFLCPAPGYDRHFGITQTFGIEMVTIPMTPTGPDMDMVEEYVNHDPTVKGIWCVPKYSNPDGYTYSDETVRRFAALKPAAHDFRIFWDNAYCIHDLTDTPDVLLNLMDECKKRGTEDMVYMFASTSKISFSGAGVAAMAMSEKNLAWAKKFLTMQTISFDKVNQLRHTKFFQNKEGIQAHMKKHRALIKPRFDLVLNMLDHEIAGLGIAEWGHPNGGYFFSLNVMPGCAKRVVTLCKEAGVVLTGAGASFPYGIDPKDTNIRIAPTYPSLEELEKAAEVLCLCVKLAAVEKLLEQKQSA
ncbi:MAG: aminotransferase class I/II-fold pyridoxal phosphate-dependent enzyme [Candidatus Merdivicinus sp.]|jgi:aspartate/methionine/tyrosine aminotransferase